MTAAQSTPSADASTSPARAEAIPQRSGGSLARARTTRLRGGGTDGNGRLTSLAGSALLAPLLVILVTLLSLRSLMSVHLFVGLMLIPPVLLKMASTGYRFVRYYTHDRVYRERGAPPTPLRLLAPVVAVSTVVVLASGVALLIVGPASRGALVSIHKLSFIVWGVVTGLHVLAHLGQTQRDVRTELGPATLRAHAALAGRDGRLMAVAGALVAGAVVSVLLIPEFSAWVHWSAQAHHHGH